MRETNPIFRTSVGPSPTTYRTLLIVMGVVSVLLVISGGVTAEDGGIEVRIFEPEGATIMLLILVLTTCLLMVGSLGYELFVSDIVRMREMVDDYWDR
jgi:hypothetical protein